MKRAAAAELKRATAAEVKVKRAAAAAAEEEADEQAYFDRLGTFHGPPRQHTQLSGFEVRFLVSGPRGRGVRPSCSGVSASR